MAILYWLMTLNSVVNPWIYMFFNVSLVETLWNACRRPWPPAAHRPGGNGGANGNPGGPGGRANRPRGSSAAHARGGFGGRQGSPVTAVTEVGRSGSRTAYLAGGRNR